MDMKTALEALEQAVEKVEKKDTRKDLGFAVVERMCLIRDDMTISIPNIARLSASSRYFTEETETSKLVWAIRGVVALVAIAIIASARRPTDHIAAWLLIFAVVYFATMAMPKAVKSKASTLHKLHIHTNDGGEYVFRSFNRQLIVDLRRIVTDKMNGRDEAATYNINFEKGVIQNMEIGNVGSVGAIVSGQGNQVMAGAGNARVNTADDNSTVVRIDYGQALPAIAEWKAYLENNNHREVAARFDELERLLKSGTPTQQERYRLRDLLQDLGAVFSSSTQAIQLFDLIRKLAGF